MKKINPQTIVALKHALTNMYWYKKDIKSFFYASIHNQRILGAINWDDPKIEFVSRIIDIMINNEEKLQNEILNLIEQVCNFNTYSHFDTMPNGSELKIKAQSCISELRLSCKGWLDEKKEIEAKEKVRENYNLAMKKSKDYQIQLEQLKIDYITLSKELNSQHRGFQLEKFLNKLFAFFDLDPRGSFKIIGEQVDGSFTHEGTDYLIEAKWTAECIDRNETDIFYMKIDRKLKNTLGLFISINGFIENVLNGCVKYNNMILMDSMDLIQVLENRVSLSQLIALKRKHASETGEIMHRINT